MRPEACAHHQGRWEREGAGTADRYPWSPITTADHVGRGRPAELKQKYKLPRGWHRHDKSTKIANADARVKEGDARQGGGISPQGCWKTPGHNTGSRQLCPFDSEKALFARPDTLFSIGLAGPACSRALGNLSPDGGTSLLQNCARAARRFSTLLRPNEYTAANRQIRAYRRAGIMAALRERAPEESDAVCARITKPTCPDAAWRREEGQRIPARPTKPSVGGRACG